VEFRLIVFRPFKNEVMIGRISSSNPEGIRLRTHFFDEIFVGTWVDLDEVLDFGLLGVS